MLYTDLSQMLLEPTDIRLWCNEFAIWGSSLLCHGGARVTYWYCANHVSLDHWRYSQSPTEFANSSRFTGSPVRGSQFAKYDHSTTYVTTGLLHCNLNINRWACWLRLARQRRPCYVTVTFMTFDKQSNARRTAIDSKSNRSCNHRINVSECSMTLSGHVADHNAARPTDVDEIAIPARHVRRRVTSTKPCCLPVLARVAVRYLRALWRVRQRPVNIHTFNVFADTLRWCLWNTVSAKPITSSQITFVSNLLWHLLSAIAIQIFVIWRWNTLLATMHYIYKKLSYRWQIARRIYANAMAWLTS